MEISPKYTDKKITKIYRKEHRVCNLCEKEKKKVDLWLAYICQNICMNEQKINLRSYLLGEMKTRQMGQEWETSAWTSKIHFNIWNMHVDCLLNFLKFKTRYEKNMTLCLGYFDMGHFNTVLNIQFL